MTLILRCIKKSLKTCKYNGPLFQGANHVKHTMERPEIGSMWKHKNLTGTIIKIVRASGIKQIAYTYIRDGHTGGCNSCEWFYSEWDPL